MVFFTDASRRSQSRTNQRVRPSIAVHSRSRLNISRRIEVLPRPALDHSPVKSRVKRRTNRVSAVSIIGGVIPKLRSKRESRLQRSDRARAFSILNKNRRSAYRHHAGRTEAHTVSLNTAIPPHPYSPAPNPAEAAAETPQTLENRPHARVPCRAVVQVLRPCINAAQLQPLPKPMVRIQLLQPVVAVSPSDIHVVVLPSAGFSRYTAHPFDQ